MTQIIEAGQVMRQVTNTDGSTSWQQFEQAVDAGPSWTSVHGVSGLPVTGTDVHTTPASVTDAPTTNTQHIVATDIFVGNTSANTMQFTFKEETSGTVITGPWPVSSGQTIQLTPRGKLWKLPVANKKLQVQTDIAGAFTVDVGYYSEA